MFKEYIKWFLFLSSYIPLFIIFTIKYYNYSWLLGIVIFIILSSIFVLYFSIKRAEHMSGDYYNLKTVENKSNQFLEYILAYIIPLLGFNLTSISDIISLVLLFILIAILYIRSDLIYMNPVLSIIGYNLYKVNAGKSDIMVISTKKLLNNQSIKIYFISEFIGVTTKC